MDFVLIFNKIRSIINMFVCFIVLHYETKNVLDTYTILIIFRDVFYTLTNMRKP